jgi:hypothetical protein
MFSLCLLDHLYLIMKRYASSVQKSFELGYSTFRIRISFNNRPIFIAYLTVYAIGLHYEYNPIVAVWEIMAIYCENYTVRLFTRKKLRHF